MNNLYYKIKSFFPSKQGQESLDNLLFVLNNSGIDVKIEKNVDENGETYVAHSTNTGNKKIMTSGRTLEELNHNLKDAIFTIYHVPRFYCNHALIKSSLIEEKEHLVYATA